MEKLELKVNFTALVIISLLPITAIGIIFSILGRDIAVGNPSWSNFIIALLILAAPLYLILGAFNEIKVDLGEKGITKRQVFSLKHIEWKDIVQTNITRLYGNVWTIDFVTAERKIGINTLYFKNAIEIVNLVERKLPKEKITYQK